MIYFILHHTGLELVTNINKEIFQHPAIQNDIRRRKKESILLDLAVHYSAIPFEQRDQRGRPDIVHLSLLEFIFSIKNLVFNNPNLGSSIKLIIHTRNDRVFEVPQDWRVPVSYIRFRGLMEKILTEGELSISNFSIKVRFESLINLISFLSPTRIIFLTKKGKIKLNPFLSSLYSAVTSTVETWIILIGGYQKGTIPLPHSLSPNPESLSLFPIGLPAWKIIGVILDYLLLNL
ncbi:MAG: hypothetical protein ACXAC7_06860 [Candidatus Hodarchaeales archaeon]|jgi:rRNA small subunit pseudouridine methyltransferase Nep1